MKKYINTHFKSWGGSWRRLKRKNPLKGFTLVELIVVIIILAILAAILIPGLLKWIDQAKNKKYELEARGIAQAAEAALTKMYAQGTGVLERQADGWLKKDDSTELIGLLGDEIEKFTDAEVEVTGIEIYGNSDGSASGWGGSANGFKITFTSDGVPITAELSPDTDNRWDINGSSDGTGGESGDVLDAFDNDSSQYVQEANAIAKAAKKALATVYATGDVPVEEHYVGWLYYNSWRMDWMELGSFTSELAKLTNADIDIKNIKRIYLYGQGGPHGGPNFLEEYPDGNVKPWEGNVYGFRIWFKASDGTRVRAFYRYNNKSDYGLSDTNDTDGWVIDINPENGYESWNPNWDD